MTSYNKSNLDNKNSILNVDLRSGIWHVQDKEGNILCMTNSEEKAILISNAVNHWNSMEIGQG